MCSAKIRNLTSKKSMAGEKKKIPDCIGILRKHQRVVTKVLEFSGGWHQRANGMIRELMV